MYSCWEPQINKYQHECVNSFINHSTLGLKNCHKQRGDLITTPKAGYCYDNVCVVYTHLYVLTYKSLLNPKILDNIKCYVMACSTVLYRLTNGGHRGGCFVTAGCTRVCRDDSLWCDRQRWSRCHDDNRFSVSLNACVIYPCTECIFYHIVLSQKWLDKDDQTKLNHKKGAKHAKPTS